MLTDKLREGATGPVAKVIFFLIIISFAIAGVGSYVMPKTNFDPVKVNGVSIKNAELENQFRIKRNQMERQYGDQFIEQSKDRNFLNSLRSETLESMINDQVLADHMFKEGIDIHSDLVKYKISKMPEFMVDGQFSNEQYRQVLSRAGYSPESFGQAVRSDLAREVYLRTILENNFVLPKEATALASLLAEQRTFRTINLNLDTFKKAVSATAEEEKVFYEAHKNDYLLPEKMKVSYIFLKADDLQPLVKYTDADLEKYFNLHSEIYTVPEKRIVAHILVTGDDAEKKINDIDAKLKAGADFATLAKEYSEDPSSKDNGGVLPAFSLGNMDASFEKAAFALANVNDVSAPVNSQFGWHLIKLVKVEPSYHKEFANVKADVIDRYTKEMSGELFLDKRQIISDKSYENPDSLDVAANSANEGAETPLIKIEQSDYIVHGGTDLPVPFGVDKVQAALFNRDFIEGNVNSDVIDIGEHALLVVHVDEYVAPAPKKFEEVESLVKDRVLLSNSANAAKEVADKVLADIKAGASLKPYIDAQQIVVSAEQTLDRTATASVDVAVLNNLFAMPVAPQGKLSVAQFANAEGTPYIIAFSGVVKADGKSAENFAKSYLAQADMMTDNSLIVKAARDNSKIEYNNERDYQKMVEDQQF